MYIGRQRVTTTQRLARGGIGVGHIPTPERGYRHIGRSDIVYRSRSRSVNRERMSKERNTIQLSGRRRLRQESLGSGRGRKIGRWEERNNLIGYEKEGYIERDDIYIREAEKRGKLTSNSPPPIVNGVTRGRIYGLSEEGEFLRRKGSMGIEGRYIEKRGGGGPHPAHPGKMIRGEMRMEDDGEKKEYRVYKEYEDMDGDPKICHPFDEVNNKSPFYRRDAYDMEYTPNRGDEYATTNRGDTRNDGIGGGGRRMISRVVNVPKHSTSMFPRGGNRDPGRRPARLLGYMGRPEYIDKLENRIGDLTVDIKILRQVVMEQSSKLWKYGEILKHFDNRNKEVKHISNYNIEYPIEDRNVLRVNCRCADGSEFRSIGEALEKANDGMTIVVEEGLYIERVNIRYSIRVIGIGTEVHLRPNSGTAMVIRGNGVVIENIQIKCEVGDTKTESDWHTGILSIVAHCIDVNGKGLEINACDISSTSGHGIYCDPADTTEKRRKRDEDEKVVNTGILEERDDEIVGSINCNNCRIHHTSNCGIFIAGSCKVSVEDCVIESCGMAGIESRDTAKININRSKITNCAKSGIFLHAAGYMNIYNSDVINCGMAGIEIAKNSLGCIQGCRVYKGLKGGIFVHDNAKLKISDSEISGNAMSNLDVRARGDVHASNNIITESRTSGVYISAKGEATLKDNFISRNGGNGIELNSGTLICLSNKIVDNQRSAIFANGVCNGTIRDNDLRYNQDKSLHTHHKGKLPDDCGDNMTDMGGEKYENIANHLDEVVVEDNTEDRDHDDFDDGHHDG